jgi:hypothetical protein
VAGLRFRLIATTSSINNHLHKAMEGGENMWMFSALVFALVPHSGIVAQTAASM